MTIKIVCLQIEHLILATPPLLLYKREYGQLFSHSPIQGGTNVSSLRICALCVSKMVEWFKSNAKLIRL